MHAFVLLGLLSVCLVLLGIGVGLGGADERRRLRKLRLLTCLDAPRNEGREVKVFGKAFCDDELVSPLKKQRCALYRLTFFGYEGRNYTEVYRTMVSAPGFSVIDRTGKLELDAHGADLRLRTVTTGADGIGGDGAVSALIDEHLSGRRVPSSPRVTEEVVTQGTALLAVGTLSGGKLAGPRLLLSALPETELLRLDRGDLAAAALILGGLALGAVTLAVLLH